MARKIFKENISELVSRKLRLLKMSLSVGILITLIYILFYLVRSPQAT